jgi:putative DNA primase/helicase
MSHQNSLPAEGGPVRPSGEQTCVAPPDTPPAQRAEPDPQDDEGFCSPHVLPFAPHEASNGRTPTPPGSEVAVAAVRPKAQRKTRVKPELPPDPSELTDDYLARRFVDRYGDRLRFCPLWGSWLEYDGTRWCRDATNTPLRLARETVRSLHEYVSRIKDRGDRQKFTDAVRRTESRRAIEAILRLAQSDERVVVLPEVFDQDVTLLNCRNGTLDLFTEDFRQHDPSDLLTKITPVDYDPAATCRTWDAFLTRVMGEDAETIAFLRRVTGYSLTGDVSEHCMFLMFGNGRNGKSVFLNALLHVSGDYGMTAPSTLLTSAGRNQHPTALADLNGMRLVVVSEPNEGRFDEALVKSMTGGDSIRARHMHSDFHEFQPTHKFLMASNHKPEVRDAGLAIWRRLRLITFGVTIPLDEVDPALPAKLQAEASGILNWAVRGCKEWRERRLETPEKVRQDTMAYRDTMDRLGGFLTECCVQGPSFCVKSTDLYASYQAWCTRSRVDLGDRVKSIKEFGALLDQKGIYDKKRSVMFRLGIALKGTDTGVATPPDASSGTADADATGTGTDADEPDPAAFDHCY